MEKILRIEESTATGRWSYDADADVLYLSPAEPKPAEGMDIGGGMIALYDEETGEVVGLTIMGLRRKVLRELTEEQ